MNIARDLKSVGYELSLLQDRLGVIGEGIVKTSGTNGEIWECGAFRGGTVLWMKGHLNEVEKLGGNPKKIRAFDTFEGLPFSGKFDVHKVGDLCAEYAPFAKLMEGLKNIEVHRGVMPDTFKGLESSVISVAHIDVDQYESVKACLEFVYPRVHPRGLIIVDDYNCQGCPGAKKATDDFLADKPEKLIIPGRPNPQVRFWKL